MAHIEKLKRVSVCVLWLHICILNCELNFDQYALMLLSDVVTD